MTLPSARKMPSRLSSNCSNGEQLTVQLCVRQDVVHSCLGLPVFTFTASPNSSWGDVFGPVRNDCFLSTFYFSFLCVLSAFPARYFSQGDRGAFDYLSCEQCSRLLLSSNLSGVDALLDELLPQVCCLQTQKQSLHG